MHKPVKILQVIGSLNRGGIEVWLMHILRHTDRQAFEIDFLVHEQGGLLEDEARKCGATIHFLPVTPLSSYIPQLIRLAQGYDVVHSHVHHFSGLLMALTRAAGVKVRIAHSHTAQVESRRLYPRLMQALIRRFATHRLAASAETNAALFGGAGQVLYCGIDLVPFCSGIDYNPLPNLPPKAYVIGHVGRFDRPKNQAFLLDILPDILQQKRNAHLVLAGDGALRESLQNRARQMNLADHVTFTGVSPHVAAMMLNNFDVFALPSLYEGLPLVAMEAQAAGLLCVLSDTITREAAILPEAVRFVALSDRQQWVNLLLSSGYIPRDKALAAVTASPFNVENSLSDLLNIYSSGHML